MLDDEGFITLERGVQLKPYKPRPFKAVELMTEQDLNSCVGQFAFVDVELYKNYYLVGFKFQNGKYLSLEAPFNERLLSWIMHNYKTVGFNSIKYDLPIIWYSYVTQDCRDLQQLSNALILENLWHQEAQKEFKFTIHQTPHIDLIEVAPLRGSLKLYGARLHSFRLQELPYPIDKELTLDEKLVVKNYNYNDLDITEEMFVFMKERIELREAMSREYQENLLSKSDAQIAEIVLVKEVTKINGVRPKRLEPANRKFKYNPPPYLIYQTPVLQQLLETIKNATFVIGESGKVGLPEELKSSVKVGSGEYRLGIGGLHSSEENVCYKATDDISIVDRDVTSYYPRLTTTLGLYPKSMGPAYLTAYEKIIQSRIAAKEAKRTSEANGKKIVVNGAGGKYSDPYSILYDPELTIQQNVTGQLDLLLLVEILTLCEFIVISANTDGIVTLVKKDQEAKYLECVTYWENVTGFKTEETRYSSYYARDVNSYFAVKADAKTIKDIKVKGPYSEVGSQSGTQLDTNPTTQICTDAVKHLLLSGTPIEQTIKECKDFTRFITVRQCKAPGAHKNYEYLGRVIRWYYAKGELGAINTVQANNKVADSDGGKPVMDLPKELPQNINYEWYIAKTIEMLQDIAYYKREQQLKFF